MLKFQKLSFGPLLSADDRIKHFHPEAPSLTNSAKKVSTKYFIFFLKTLQRGKKQKEVLLPIMLKKKKEIFHCKIGVLLQGLVICLNITLNLHQILAHVLLNILVSKSF